MFDDIHWFNVTTVHSIMHHFTHKTNKNVSHD